MTDFFSSLTTSTNAIPLEIQALNALNNTLQTLNTSIQTLNTSINNIKTTIPSFTSCTMVSPAVNVLLVSVVIAPANANRKGFMIWNNSSNSAYVTFGPTSNSSTPNSIVPTFTTLTFIYGYTGAISAIRNAGSGTCVVWEFT